MERLADQAQVSEGVNTTYDSNGIPPTPGPSISVILPAYNEAGSIRKVIMDYNSELSGKFPLELIVAEDGSVDGTKEIIDSMKTELGIIPLSELKRKGLAKCVNDAFRSCSGDWIFVSDADGQFSPLDFWKLWPHHERYDMIIGARDRRTDSLYRLLMARGFQILVKALFGLNLRDGDAGFRLIRREIVRSVGELRFLPHSSWIELGIRAHAKGFKIIEVTVGHSKRMYGNSRIIEMIRVPIIIIRQLKGLALLYLDLMRTH